MNNSKLFKAYVSILLTIITLSVVAILIFLIYAGIKTKATLSTYGTKIDSLNQQINDVNKNISNYQAQQQNALSKVPPGY